MPQDRVEAAHFSPDIQEFIKLLHKHGVHYLIAGVTFDEAWPTRREATLVSKEEDTPLYYLGLKQLIKNKQAAGRPKDLEDLAYLRQAARNDDM